MEKHLIQLSKLISRILRHEPWLYELELDREGWVSVKELLLAVKSLNKNWIDLSESDIKTMIEQSPKKRHELKNNQIRALYGHSTPQKLIKYPAEPPEVLYHGTSSELMPTIYKEGLKPMRRHYVHLSIDKETAFQVGKRKSSNCVILMIDAKKAYEAGVLFYAGNEHVWLADFIDSKYFI